MDLYDIGDQPRITVTFTNIAGVATDPSAVECVVRAPDGTETTPTPTNGSGDGEFYIDLPLDQNGLWHVRFAGTGTVTAAVEQSILVRRPHTST